MLFALRQRKVWLFLGPIAALLLILTGMLALKIPLQAHAAGTTLYVGHTIGTNASCASPGFTSVQMAVDAAIPGDTVYLCGTTPYTEQVVITKSITVTGDHGATIAAPNPFPTTPPSRLPPQFTTDNLFVPQAIVFIWGPSVNVKILKINVAGVLPGNGSCANNEFGVLVIDDATATLNGDTVKDIRDSNPGLYGCQFGVGIQVGREYWPKADFSGSIVEDFVGHATITKTTVYGYQKNGMTIDGPGTTGSLWSDTVNGDGQGGTLSQIIAQNGIQISRGASVQVSDSTVTGNAYTGSGGASSGGILVYGGSCDGPATPLTTGTNVLHNNLQNNDVGVFISNLSLDGNSQCSLPTTATNIVANSNHITNGAVTNTSGTNLFNYPGGYQAGISDEGYGDRLTNNKICGVGYTPIPNPPPYLSMIDIVATNPIVHGNTTCKSSAVVQTSASAKTGKMRRLHHLFSPVK